MADRGASISRRAPKFESFFESRWVVKSLGFWNHQHRYRLIQFSGDSIPRKATRLVIQDAPSSRSRRWPPLILQQHPSPPKFLLVITAPPG